MYRKNIGDVCGDAGRDEHGLRGSSGKPFRHLMVRTNHDSVAPQRVDLPRTSAGQRYLVEFTDARGQADVYCQNVCHVLRHRGHTCRAYFLYEQFGDVWVGPHHVGTAIAFAWTGHELHHSSKRRF